MKKFLIKLYSLDELSEDAKSRICEKERETTDNWGYFCQEQDARERKETLDKFCETFGITYRIDLDHCYRFVHWRFESYDIDDKNISGKLLWRFLNKYYYDIRSRKYYGKLIPHEVDKEHPAGLELVKRYSRIQWEEQNCPFTGMCYDCDILQKIFDWYKKPDWKLSLHDLFDECFNLFFKSWSDEDDYRMSDENILDMISANEPDQLYLEDGTKFEGSLEELEELVA